MEGDPKYAKSQVVPEFPYARYAELLGLNGIRVERSEDVGRAWEQALASDIPSVVEMVTDPDVPPIPPHVSAKQARAYFSALLQRDPDAIGMIQASFKEVWDGLFPPSEEKQP